jgi:hypothetical protein
MISKFSPTPSSFSKDAPKINARYPEANFESDTDFVKITFYDYVAPFSTQGGGSNGITNDPAKSFAAYNSSAVSIGKSTSTISLYMPEDMDGQYGGNWNQMNLSTVARGALGGFGQAAGGEYGESLKAGLDTALTTGGNFLTKGTGVANAISDILQKTNFGSVTVNEVFSVTTGQILNPNTEVLYNGPKMRTFGLNFKMAPRNENEANNIKNIIHAFKYASLPRYGGAGDEAASFVRVPQLVDVTFMKGNTEHPWVTQYKPSVITDFSVSYTPDGAWATLPNGSPVATTIKISFLETKMVYADEVSGTGATY